MMVTGGTIVLYMSPTLFFFLVFSLRLSFRRWSFLLFAAVVCDHCLLSFSLWVVFLAVAVTDLHRSDMCGLFTVPF